MTRRTWSYQRWSRSTGTRTVCVLPAGTSSVVRVPVDREHRWYDHALRVKELTGFGRRLAGHLENGEPSVSDPAMAGAAQLDQFRF